jgi:hypothetical protein
MIRIRFTQERFMTENMAADLAWGVDEISRVIGRDRRATYHLLATQKLPARKVGAMWVASRARLRDFLTGEAA